ncbi:MAG: PaaI family thioesterase, partial [Bacteroidota bacterium]
MKKLSNPFLQFDGYNCFACDPHNQEGLQMEFYEDGDYILSEWEPQSYFQGYSNILHGGIQGTLMDEIASWTVYVKAKSVGVTAEMNVKFRKPVYVNKGSLTIRGKLKELSRKFAFIQGELFDHEGNLCAEADIK